MRLKLLSPLVLAIGGTAGADVFTSEFFSDPVSEGWEQLQQYCDPTTWNDNGWYHQVLDFEACGPPPGGGQDSYVRSITEFNGEPEFYCEFRVLTDGDRSEIPGGAPVGFAMFNSFGINYHLTIARDRVRFLRDVQLPILYFDIEPDVPHTYRIELSPGWYRFYIDTLLANEGVPEGPYPSENATITWRGKAYYLPCHNQWDFFRYGVTQQEGSGDYDSDGEVNEFDFYFFQDYFSGTDVPVLPGGRFADFDFDGDIDCDDWEAFQLAWTDPEDPPVLPPCFFDPIPAVSDWGIAVMTLLLLTAGTILFRRVPRVFG
jgi:hypothetical protein